MNVNIYASDVLTIYGLYSIDIETGERRLVRIPESSGLSSIKLSPDGRYVLGEKFDRENFLTELMLVDLRKHKIYQLSMTPNNRVWHNGQPAGSHEKFGFSPDSRFIVITFPNGVEVLSGDGVVPLLSNDATHDEPSVVLINIRKWLETKGRDTITKISGCDYPSFNQSTSRFVVPVKSLSSTGMKLMLYEILPGDDYDCVPRFSGYELPLIEVLQAKFASDTELFIFSQHDLLMYDLRRNRIHHIISFQDQLLSGSGYIPSALSSFNDFSTGPVSLGKNRFAYLIPEPRQTQYFALEGGSVEIPTETKTPVDTNLVLIHGQMKSPYVERIEIPRLPDTVYSDYLLYHYLHIPQITDDKAILFSCGWQYQAFRVIDFTDDSVSDPVPGFFIGMSPDLKGLIYIQCGEDNCCQYKGTNFTWQAYRRLGKNTHVPVNDLYYWDFETGEHRKLLKEPSHISEAFFVDKPLQYNIFSLD